MQYVYISDYTLKINRYLGMCQEKHKNRLNDADLQFTNKKKAKPLIVCDK